jgi:hypothetical protein
MTKRVSEQLRRACVACCRNWPHTPDGVCAPICMDRLGDVPWRGCLHAAEVHESRVWAIVNAFMSPVNGEEQ